METIDRIPEAFYVPAKARPPRLQNIIEHDKVFALQRPPVPGQALEYVYIPAMGFMLGRVIKKGHVIRIIDLEGQQVADAIIWDARNLDNVLNCCWTQLLNKKWSQWRPGDALFSTHCSKLATITEDTTDGRHAATGSFCSEQSNYTRYGIHGTANCCDNFVAAMAPFGFSAKDIDWGSCFTFFMDVPCNPDGSLGIREAPGKPGDYVDLMAEIDIIIAISNCPSTRSPTNAYNPTSLMAVVFDPNSDYRVKADSLPKPDVLPV